MKGRRISEKRGRKIANEEINLVSMLNQGEFDLASQSIKAKGEKRDGHKGEK